MDRKTPATAELAIPTLVNTIKAHLAKAAQAADKAKQHYITAGLRLKELKLRKPGATPWPEYVRETFGLGQQRADELIRIADGRTTVEAVHASQKTRDAKRRPPKSNVAHIESPGLKPDDAKLISKQRLVVACLPDVAEQLIAKMAGNPTPVDEEPKTSEPVDSGMTVTLNNEWREPLVSSGKYLGVPVAEYVGFLLVLGTAAFNRKFQNGLTSQIERWLVDMHSKYPDTFNVGSWEGSCGHLSIDNLRAKGQLHTEPTAPAATVKPVSDVTHAAEPKLSDSAPEKGNAEMITPAEIEKYALKLAEPDFVVSGANIDSLVGHLTDHDYELVMGRAQEISRERHPSRRRPATPAERALRERAERLGFKLSRRGSEYNLTEPDGTGFGGTSLDGINQWLDVIEYKLPVQICYPCGTPAYKINDPDAADAEADTKPEGA